MSPSEAPSFFPQSCLRLSNIPLAFLKKGLIYPDRATRYLNSQAVAFRDNSPPTRIADSNSRNAVSFRRRECARFEIGDAKFAISNMELSELTWFTGLRCPKARFSRSALGREFGARLLWAVNDQ